MNRSDDPVLGPYHSAGVEPVREEETCQCDYQDGYSNDERLPRELRPPSKENGLLATKPLECLAPCPGQRPGDLDRV